MTTMTLNNEKNGIEIRFGEKPLQGTLTMLKTNGFRWHSQGKFWYAKQTAERLELAQMLADTENYAEKVRAEVAAEEAAAAPKKKETTNIFGIQIGDVFYNSWGWEQTNIDFWQVVELRGKTQIVLRAIGHEGRDIAFCQQMVKPVKDAFTKHYAGETIRKTVKGTKENPYCNMEHGLLYKTDWETEHNETSYY